MDPWTNAIGGYSERKGIVSPGCRERSEHAHGIRRLKLKTLSRKTFVLIQFMIVASCFQYPNSWVRERSSVYVASAILSSFRPETNPAGPPSASGIQLSSVSFSHYPVSFPLASQPLPAHGGILNCGFLHPRVGVGRIPQLLLEPLRHFSPTKSHYGRGAARGFEASRHSAWRTPLSAKRAADGDAEEGKDLPLDDDKITLEGTSSPEVEEDGRTREGTSGGEGGQLTGLEFVESIVRGGDGMQRVSLDGGGDESVRAVHDDVGNTFSDTDSDNGPLEYVDTTDDGMDDAQMLDSLRESARQVIRNCRRQRRNPVGGPFGKAGFMGRGMWGAWDEDLSRRNEMGRARRRWRELPRKLHRRDIPQGRVRGLADCSDSEASSTTSSDKSSESTSDDEPGANMLGMSRETANMLHVLGRLGKRNKLFTTGVHQRPPGMQRRSGRARRRRTNYNMPEDYGMSTDTEMEDMADNLGGEAFVGRGMTLPSPLYVGRDEDEMTDGELYPDFVNLPGDIDMGGEGAPILNFHAAAGTPVESRGWLRNMQKDIPLDKGLLERQIQIVKDIMGLQESHVGIELVGDREIRELNRHFLGKDKSTDILSFPFTDDPGVLRAFPLLQSLHGRRVYGTQGVPLGRIFVCPAYIERRCDTDRTAVEESILFGKPSPKRERGVSGLMSEVFSVQERLPLLLIHGFLHLLRFDHGTPRDHLEMASKEEKIAAEFLKRSREYRPSQAGQYVIGVGTDVCYIPRVRKALEMNEDRFLKHVCSPRERRQYQLLKERYLEDINNRKTKHREWGDIGSAYLAKRFATKEAVAKSLGTGLRHVTEKGIRLKDIEVWSLPSGQPTVQLLGAGRDTAHALGVVDILVAQTDERDLAVSFATACGSTSDAIPGGSIPGRMGRGGPT